MCSKLREAGSCLEFLDWDSFVNKFQSTFVRTVRKSDLLRELKSSVQSPSEPTINYFYSKVGFYFDQLFTETSY